MPNNGVLYFGWERKLTMCFLERSIQRPGSMGTVALIPKICTPLLWFCPSNIQHKGLEVDKIIKEHTVTHQIIQLKFLHSVLPRNILRHVQVHATFLVNDY
jgi:hypothetical protein